MQDPGPVLLGSCSGIQSKNKETILFTIDP